MKKILRKFVNRYLNTKLALPLTFLVIFFIISGLLVLYFELSHNEQFKNFIDAFWWAIITFSTTGYGDKVPVTLGGRIIAVFSIFIGIGIMSFLSGTLASFFVEQNAKARRGLMDFKRMKDHYIICGWKNNINEILKEILKLNREKSADDIIIISNIEPEKIEELKKERGLAGVHFVKGDYSGNVSLTRANVQSASKVIVLADKFECGTVEEVDSKSVMTVLSIRGLSRDVYICVELIDKKYTPYLKQAMCDEIIYSRDYARMILANSSATNGISQIFYSLISPEEGTGKLATYPIPGQFMNKPYLDLKKYIGNKYKDKLLLGLLENTGSPNKLKKDALREAQKTSDTSRLVANLQQVKELIVNKPVLLPENEYIIKKYSMSILLEKINGNGV